MFPTIGGHDVADLGSYEIDSIEKH